MNNEIKLKTNLFFS